MLNEKPLNFANKMMEVNTFSAIGKAQPPTKSVFSEKLARKDEGTQELDNRRKDWHSKV